MSNKYIMWDVLWTPCDDVEKNQQSAMNPKWELVFTSFLILIELV